MCLSKSTNCQLRTRHSEFFDTAPGRTERQRHNMQEGFSQSTLLRCQEGNYIVQFCAGKCLPVARHGRTTGVSVEFGQFALPERTENIRKVKNRSEEHTSELQSPDHLVCRLLLEKKKTIQ